MKLTMKSCSPVAQTFTRVLFGVLWVAASAIPVQNAIAADAASSASAQAAATQLIREFARASDKSDFAALQIVLHPAFRVVFNLKPGAAPTVLDRSQYLKLVSDGKVGGADRQVSISAISVGDGFASATARMVRPDAAFQGNYTLIQQDGQWWLLEEAVLMSVGKVTQ